MVDERRIAASAPESGEVIIQNPARLPVSMVAKINDWLDALISALCPGASFGARLDSDRAVADANRRWRRMTGPTDVLSFPGEAGEGERHLGDVLIAVPTARRQAQAAGHSLERELKILLLHGALHCLGYDHETDDGTMARLESKLRRKWIASGGQRAVESRS